MAVITIYKGDVRTYAKRVEDRANLDAFEASCFISTIEHGVPIITKTHADNITIYAGTNTFDVNFIAADFNYASGRDVGTYYYQIVLKDTATTPDTPRVFEEGTIVVKHNTKLKTDFEAI